jgi:hypothetical protein
VISGETDQNPIALVLERAFRTTEDKFEKAGVCGGCALLVE